MGKALCFIRGLRRGDIWESWQSFFRQNLSIGAKVGSARSTPERHQRLKGFHPSKDINVRRSSTPWRHQRPKGFHPPEDFPVCPKEFNSWKAFQSCLKEFNSRKAFKSCPKGFDPWKTCKNEGVSIPRRRSTLQEWRWYFTRICDEAERPWSFWQLWDAHWMSLIATYSILSSLKGLELNSCAWHKHK